MEAEIPSLPFPQACREFSLDEILLVTQNFDEALVVGEGGFGKVYKATINVDNGEIVIVAIKRLDSSSNQGAPEFWAEIKMLTKLRHCNLVSLIGYCNDKSEMILVYEFMPNGTLDDHLHRYGTTLSWVQRLKISIGAARGLHYLHSGTGIQHGVIHRDVKSTNILLDEDYAARISDFGLSKIGPTNTSDAYVKTRVRGTFGYFDPDYYLTGRLTSKSDVFAFGVVLFELLCRRVAVDNHLDDDECSLVKWAHESIEKGKVYEIIDFNIKSQISPKCLKVYVQIADRCLSSEPKKRPTMAEILVALELSLTLQNKYDSNVKPDAILTFARMIKWPFISTRVNSAKNDSDSKLSTIIEDTIQYNSSSKEDRLDHVPAQTKSLEKDNIYHASSSKKHSNVRLRASSPWKTHIWAYGLKEFSFDDLKNATRDFTQDMWLGGGALGGVFEGWLDTNTSSMSVADDPVKIAIKRFYPNLFEKPELDMIFLYELKHPNLVKVLGYCLEDETLFLIYEFVENGSLDSHLFTTFADDKIPLPWNIRVKIIVGIAKALLFLQRENILSDIPPMTLHNILLDKNFNPKISDFESVNLVNGDPEIEIDPLYYHPAAFHSKHNDVAFGEVLVHILTGERSCKTGLDKLKKCMKNRTGIHLKESLRRALDPRLPDVDATTIKKAAKVAGVALGCLENPDYTLDSALNVLTQL